MMQSIIAWAIQSTQFKKWSGIIGGFAGGLWCSMNYHVQIRATLQAWGVDRDQWGNFLILVIGASGVAASVGLSVAKNRLAAQGDASVPPDVETAARGLQEPKPLPSVQEIKQP
jgi:hypothetical protein